MEDYVGICLVIKKRMDLDLVVVVSISFDPLVSAVGDVEHLQPGPKM